MLLVPCIWILTSATSAQQEDSITLAQCVDSFHNCVSQTQTNGNAKLRKALEILKSLDDEDMKALDASEIRLIKHQVNILESNIPPEGKYQYTLKNEEIPEITIEKDQFSTVETSKDHENKNVEQTKKHHNQSSSAFTVELSSRRPIGQEAPLSFDEVIIDEGENFIPLLGAYRVPEPGVYAFYWSVDAPEGRVQTVLVKNGEAQKYGPLTQEIPGSFSGTSSMSAVVECDQDDFVWVKVLSWPDEEACNVVEAKYSSFSGFKIYTSSDEPRASAFTAQLSQNASFPDRPVTIVYNTALVNIGNDYYLSNGSFVCREGGVHVFTVSGHRLTSSGGYFRLNKNGSDVMDIALPQNTAVSSTDSGTSSGTAVLECARGDVITVKYSVHTSYHLAEASSFTGYRLEDDQGVVAFTAKPSVTREYTDGLQIDFDDVITNVGGGYLPDLKAFICQDQALYFLSWAFWIQPEFDQRSGEARLIKVKDGERTVMKAGPRSSRVLTNNFGRTASTQAIVRCEQNAAFYIEAVVEEGSMSYSDIATYFTGFKLPSSA
jgi:hypothetical protein